MKPSEIRVGARYRGRKGLDRITYYMAPKNKPIVGWRTDSGAIGSHPIKAFARWAVAEVKENQ